MSSSSRINAALTLQWRCERLLALLCAVEVSADTTATLAVPCGFCLEFIPGGECLGAGRSAQNPREPRPILTPSFDSRGAEPFFCLRYTPKTISGVWTGNLLSNLLIKRHRPLVGRLQNDRSEASFGDLPFGHYDIEVSAVGYIN